MNYEEIKTAIAKAISDVEDATEGILQPILDNWPVSADAEMTRLAAFEIAARECLGSGIPAGSPFVDEAGNRKRMILIDEEKALKVLGTKIAFIMLFAFCIIGCSPKTGSVEVRHYKPAPDPWWPVEPLPIDAANPWKNP